MRIFLAALWCLLVTTVVAQSPIVNFPPGMFDTRRDPPVVTYVGPLDVVSGAKFCGALRACAASNIGTAIINLIRASDSVGCDFLATAAGVGNTSGGCSAGGGLSISAFAGTDATCTGSMVGTTTLTISACASGTLHVNDTITGFGIVQPMYITAIGTCAAPPGTCTVNTAQTFISETVTAQVSLSINTLYDQSGTGNNANGGAWLFLPSCINGFPCILAANLNGLKVSSNFVFSQPNVMSLTAIRIANFTTQQEIVRIGSNGASDTELFFTSSANTIGQYSGTNVNKTANDGIWHNLQMVFNGASGVSKIDGAQATVNVGSLATFGNFCIGGSSSGGTCFAQTFNISATTEVVFWGATAVNNTQLTNVCNNVANYWSITSTC